MKITVIGSYIDPVADKEFIGNYEVPEKDLFIQACESIGELIADLGHELIVPHLTPASSVKTAEHHALEGFKRKEPFGYYACNEHVDEPSLKVHFDAVEKSDAVILIGGKNNTYASGLGALHRRKLIIPIPVFRGSASYLCDIDEIDHMVTKIIRNLEPGQENWLNILGNEIKRILNEFPRILIIHGRGDSGTELYEKILANRNENLEGIADPLIMNLTGKGSLSVPAVFEELASNVHAAIAVVTADDIGGFARGDGNTEISAQALKLEPRARENIWVEVGWFWGRLGRERILIWFKEDIELPSDLQGTAWADGDCLKNSWKNIEAFIKRLRREI